MDELAVLIARDSDGRLERALFGTASPVAVAAQILEFTAEHVGTPHAALFYRPGAGLAVGLDLGGTDDVVVKVHRAGDDQGHLRAAQGVQRHLAQHGFPAPQPLLDPTRLGSGLAVIEQFVHGQPADGHDPAIRKHMASRLHGFITMAAMHPDCGRLAQMLRRPTLPSGLWGEPHDLRFDFDATARGAEWIDEIASDAQKVLRGSATPSVIAHFDWRAENLAIVDQQVVGVYDWDSVGFAPEAVAVGQSSAHFTTDWTVGHSTLPSVQEMDDFVADYEQARGARFDEGERALIDAANLMVLCYSARCEHSDRTLHPHLAPSEDHGWAALLAHRSETRASGV